jgi:hypothetical protein
MRYDVEWAQQERPPKVNVGSAWLGAADKRRRADFLFQQPIVGPISVDTASREVQLSGREGICVQWL